MLRIIGFKSKENEFILKIVNWVVLRLCVFVCYGDGKWGGFIKNCFGINCF